MAQQARLPAPAPPGIFADSPDCLDDLDIDQLVSAHQQQAAQPQPAQPIASDAHAACSISQTSQRLKALKPAGHALSPLGASSAGVQLQAAAQRPAARSEAPDMLHASAAPRASALALAAAPRTSSGPAPSAAQAGLEGLQAAPCSHGMPLQQCWHKQDHLNQVNADLVKILLNERPAQPGEQDRLKALKKAIEECIEREVKGGLQGVEHRSTTPAAALAPNAPGMQGQQSMAPTHGWTVDGGMCGPAASPEAVLNKHTLRIQACRSLAHPACRARSMVHLERQIYGLICTKCVQVQQCRCLGGQLSSDATSQACKNLPLAEQMASHLGFTAHHQSGRLPQDISPLRGLAQST